MRKTIEILIEENKALIYKIASKYSAYYSIEDLFQVGVIGLLNAYKNYKSNKSTKFSTYAYQYILGEIIEYVKKDRTMRVNTNYLKIYKSYEKAKDLLTQKYGRVPSLEDISKFLEIDSGLLVEAINGSQFVLSFDGSLNQEEDTTFIETMGFDSREKIDSVIDLNQELSKLSQKEQMLINYRYYEDYTQSETAAILGMSQVQVSRNEAMVLSKIRKNIAC